jgi:hypothetical protein
VLSTAAIKEPTDITENAFHLYSIVPRYPHNCEHFKDDKWLVMAYTYCFGNFVEDLLIMEKESNMEWQSGQINSCYVNVEQEKLKVKSLVSHF